MKTPDGHNGGVGPDRVADDEVEHVAGDEPRDEEDAKHPVAERVVAEVFEAFCDLFSLISKQWDRGEEKEGR